MNSLPCALSRLSAASTAVVWAALSTSAACGGMVVVDPVDALDASADAPRDTGRAGSPGQGGTTGQGGVGGSSGHSGAAGRGGSGGGSSGTGGSSAAGGSGGGPPVRTIITRDLFDKFDTPGNLLIDGTFEFAGPTATTWGGMGSSPYPLGSSVDYGNGLVCRTGLRCLKLSSSTGAYGLWVSPDSGTVDVTLHTSPGTGTCHTLDVYVADASDRTSSGATLVTLQSEQLGQDNWCAIRGQTDAMAYKLPILYMEPTLAEVYVDDISILPTVSQSPGMGFRSITWLAPDVLARLSRAKELARDQLKGPRKTRFQPALPPHARPIPAWVR